VVLYYDDEPQMFSFIYNEIKPI